ncbi:hypothetical protein PIB30_091012 [Stylosanthes scabra]|uniref:PB1-like domain-containing protein n=1 Tax=Stylosanthes scabra TaxID=79078 RepID=A0ABU6WVJ2_9FABA|nr:hypothetical protein [Stylosanthes scabra]
MSLFSLPKAAPPLLVSCCKPHCRLLLASCRPLLASLLFATIPKLVAAMPNLVAACFVVIRGTAKLAAAHLDTGGICRRHRRGTPLRTLPSQMASVFVKPVFHHGGRFERNSGGTLEYVNGMVKEYDEMDLDFLNFGDFVKLLEELGYQDHEAAHWLDQTAVDVESGLRKLVGDSGINDLRQHLIDNPNLSEFHLYFEHPVNQPHMVDFVDLEGMSGDDVSVEEIHGDGYDGDTNEEHVAEDVVSHKGKGKCTNSTRKSAAQIEKAQRKKSSPKKKVETPKKKGTPRKKKLADRLNGCGPSKEGDQGGPTEDVELNPSHEKSLAGFHYVGQTQVGEDSVLLEYESEDMHTPVSSEDEGRKHHFPEFNNEYAFGQGRF